MGQEPSLKISMVRSSSVGTLNGKDPSKNWHPEIQKGYYYLKEQEHYLYSRAIKNGIN